MVRKSRKLSFIEVISPILSGRGLNFPLELFLGYGIVVDCGITAVNKVILLKVTVIRCRNSESAILIVRLGESFAIRFVLTTILSNVIIWKEFFSVSNAFSLLVPFIVSNSWVIWWIIVHEFVIFRLIFRSHSFGLIPNTRNIDRLGSKVILSSMVLSHTIVINGVIFVFIIIKMELHLEALGVGGPVLRRFTIGQRRVSS